MPRLDGEPGCSLNTLMRGLGGALNARYEGRIQGREDSQEGIYPGGSGCRVVMRVRKPRGAPIKQTELRKPG